MKNNNKGSIFYTLVGVMVIVLVLVVSLHIMRSTYTAEKPDEIERQKFIDAIKSVHAEIQTASRYAEYPALWKAGRNVSINGVNTYLELSDGRNRMKQDLIREYTSNLNTYLKSLSIANSSNKFTLLSNRVPVTFTEIQEEDVSVNETSTGLIFTIRTHMNSSGNNYRYENDETITSEVPVRLFDMFDRAKTFHTKYQEDVSWALTIALYSRAYMNAYNPEYRGSYLKEGHTAYDPLQQLLSGSPTALKNFNIDSIDDVGSIPLATWLSEWRYLSEPSFLPPSFDFEKSLEGNNKIINYVKRNYDIENAANCTDSACTDMNDPQVIRANILRLTEKLDALEALSADINNFEPDTDMSCTAFKKESNNIINRVLDEPDFITPVDNIISPASTESEGTAYYDPINSNTDIVNDLRNRISNLENAKIRANVLTDDLCALPEDMDCECVSGPEDCEDSDDCLRCDSPSCNKVKCQSPKSPADYTCGSVDAHDSRSEEVDCKLKQCSESCNEEGCTRDCETFETTETADIDLCNCGCHPSATMIKLVTDNLAVIRNYIEANKASLEKQITELESRMKTLVAAEKELTEINNLANTNPNLGYDVASDIRYDAVKYSTPEGWCYINTTYREAQNGTCGNIAESTGLYTAQISAAVVCCSLTGGCCSAVEYAAEFFPAIYEISATYTIDERIVDDRNRIIPLNLFTNTTDAIGLNQTPKLYTHAAPEFIIYQNRTITVKPKTADRVLVYLYLKQMKPDPLQKVLDSFSDATCKGNRC